MSLLTITSFQPQVRWHFQGSTATLRISYTDNFTNGDGVPVLRGLYQEVACTVAAGVLTVPDFALITTNDALVNPNVRCTAQFYDASGAARDHLFTDFSIPQSLAVGGPQTIGSLFTYNRGASYVNPPRQYLSRDETVALITTMLQSLGLGPATDLILGIVKLSAAASDPLNPVVWEQGDPDARDAQRWKGVDLDATMGAPADTNVPVYDALSNTWKPGVGTQGAAGGALSGTYPNPSVVNDSHLHSAATITSVPAHASSHENGGADEISVAGLSGLLADGQTPLAHAASHISGGSDPFTSAQLLEAVIKRIRTTTGPADLTVGAIVDGEFIKRNGSVIESGIPSGTGYSLVEDEGTPLTQRSTLNFTGAGVTATDSGGKTVVDIPGGGGSGSFATISKLV